MHKYLIKNTRPNTKYIASVIKHMGGNYLYEVYEEKAVCAECTEAQIEKVRKALGLSSKEVCRFKESI